jgi:hypothetical protein
LDSLCGLYSIVNAERIVNGSSAEQAQELFDRMVHFLSRRRLLTRILLDGVIHNHMLLVLEKVVNGRVPRIEIPWRSQPTPELDPFWESMRDFLDGTPGEPSSWAPTVITITGRLSGTSRASPSSSTIQPRSPRCTALNAPRPGAGASTCCFRPRPTSSPGTDQKFIGASEDVY